MKEGTGLYKTEIFRLIRKSERPLSMRTIMQQLKIPGPYRSRVKKALRELCAENKIIRAGNKFFTEQAADTARGRVDLKPNFGFLRAEKGDDIFLGRKSMENLLQGDMIEVYLRDSRKGGREGILKRIISRTDAPVMCRVKRIGSRLFACPPEREAPLIKIRPSKFDIKAGDLILVKVDEKEGSLTGSVVSHIYDRDDINMYKQFVLNRYQIKQKFPGQVSAETKAINEAGPAEGGELDIRGETVITIDPADAKDFDDAVSLVKKNGRYFLGVHIADVSRYVREDTELDKEAAVRNFSVYLPGEVIPMLPEKLSNGVCSLRENEDKMTFSVIMEIDRSGSIVDYEIKETIIRSDRRFTYEEVEDILSGKPVKVPAKIRDMIMVMEELRGVLCRKLEKEGSIDFDIGEPMLVLDDEGKTRDIVRKKSLRSHKLIEHFMVYANMCAADYIAAKLKHGMFRVHPAPAQKDIFDFNLFLNSIGMNQKIKKGTHGEFQAVLAAAKDSPKKFFIEKKLLRTMQMARYSEKNTGHFGLALKKYTHFTSPIRRYPDIIVHRIIKNFLGIKSMSDTSLKNLKNMAFEASESEERSEKAESEIFRLYALDFLKQRTGEAFEGVVTKITGSGLIVELSEYPVEGFVNYDAMPDDYYSFDKGRQAAVGRRTKNIYRTGQVLSVIILKADLETQKLHLETEK